MIRAEMRHHHEADIEVLRDRFEKLLDRLDSAGGSADADDREKGLLGSHDTPLPSRAGPTRDRLCLSTKAPAVWVDLPKRQAGALFQGDRASDRTRKSAIFVCDALARIPVGWKHLIDKNRSYFKALKRALEKSINFSGTRSRHGTQSFLSASIAMVSAGP